MKQAASKVALLGLLLNPEDGGATCSSKTSVDFERTTWRYIPEDRNQRNI
jgi:hypothetical protein